ncbi:MAG: radical SAM family heme chaperone HemW [Candidatus Omnitrophica bacterium]|nr:radical SAM family heme chaperone HemW [Candidatus Omnitrophota bacterium]
MFLVYNVSMTGLYLHLPFCAQKCHYCDFVVTTSGSPALRERFFSALETEAGRYAPVFETKPFETLYVGGGTPSFFSLGELDRVFNMLRSRFRFVPQAEVTFEVNPGDLDAVKAEFLRARGVNRISIGVQSFHSETLKRIHRSHDASAIEKSFLILRQAGFDNLSVDLMLSLPGEDLDRVKYSLEKLVELSPEHVSLYELTVEEKTVFGSLQKMGKLALPDEEETLRMLSTAREMLKDNGYVHYELLSYAKKGRESRHNLIYWANEEYLGLGPGAFSYLGGRRFRGSASVEEYLQKIEKGDWSAFEEEMLTAEKKTVESLLLALRLSEGADLGRFASLPEGVSQSIRTLEEKGLLNQDHRRLRLTPRGQFFAETVFTELSSD